MRVGVLCSRIRVEEKLLFDELETRGVAYDKLDDRALVFNLHEQFERLREEGRYERMRERILSRDLALSGSINPILARFGETSEARQYSGRLVERDWRCPFHDPRTAHGRR